MIRNAQLFAGHFDLLPGQGTHVLLPAHRPAEIRHQTHSHSHIWLRAELRPTLRIYFHTCVQSLSIALPSPSPSLC